MRRRTDVTSCSPAEPKFIHNLLGALGRPELAELCLRGPGSHQQPVIEFLGGVSQEGTLAEWEDDSAEVDVVNTLPEASRTIERDMIRRDERGDAMSDRRSASGTSPRSWCCVNPRSANTLLPFSGKARATKATTRSVPKCYRESFGCYYDDFTVGDVYEHRPGCTISESDNTWFTLMTMNQHPLHFDKEYAVKSEFKRPLVNSCLTRSMVVGMSVSDISQKAIGNLGWNDIKLTAPVFVGDNIYAELEVLAKCESALRPEGSLTVRTIGKKGDGTQFMSFERTALVAKRCPLHRRLTSGRAAPGLPKARRLRAPMSHPKSRFTCKSCAR